MVQRPEVKEKPHPSSLFTTFHLSYFRPLPVMKIFDDINLQNH